MTNAKTTKRAFFASVLSLLLCASMLIGTTFAWFTDTDTLTMGNIVAGTLNIEIVDADGNEKTDALRFLDANGGSDILWEPGVTFRTEEFSIKNNGSLNLKFKLEINNTEVSYNKLNEAISFSLIDKDGANVALNTMQDILLAPNAVNGPYRIEATMDADAGNQYQGLTLEGVSITVYAAQVAAESDSNGSDYDADAPYDDEIITAGNADEFIAAFRNFEAGQTITLTGDIDMTGKDWTPVDNKSYVLNGNGFTIKGLNGGMSDHTGSSSITIKNVTFDAMVDNSETNYAGLIGDADTCSYLNLSNVTVKNAQISSEKYAAGFVAYTSGYGVDNNGPVNASHSFTNCKVLTSSIQGGGSVGALIAHAGGNSATTTIINGVTIANNKIAGEDAAHTGVILGTSHVGEVTLNYNANQVQAGPIIGRFVPGDPATGKLTVNGEEKTAFASEELVPSVNLTQSNEALSEAITNATPDTPANVVLSGGNYTLPALTNKEITFTGDKDVVIDTTTITGATNGACLTFEGVTVKFDNDGYEGFTHSEKVVYKDCTIIGTQFLYSTTEFINCTFEKYDDATEYNVWTYGCTATFTDCVFNASGKAILVYNEGEMHATVTVNNCTFIGDGTYTDKAAIEVGSSPYSTATTYELVINNSTATGFVANNSTSPLWGNKNSMDQAHLNVKINGTDVY